MSLGSIAHSISTLKDPIRRRTQRVLTVAGYTAPLVILTFLLSQVDRTGIAQILSEADGAWLLATAAIYPLTLILDAIAFGRLLPLGTKPSLRTLLRIRLFSEPFMLLPGGALAADAAKPYFLSRECGIEIPHGIAAIAGRKLLIVLSHSISLTLAAVLGYSWLESIKPGIGSCFLIVSLLFLVTLLIVAGLLIFSLSRQFGSKRRIFRRLLVSQEQTIRSTRDLLRGIRHRPNDALKATGLLLLVWFLEAIEIYAIAHALVNGVAPEGMYIAESFSSIARSIFAFIPAGAGVQELSYTTVLSSMGLTFSVIAAISLLRRSREVLWAGIGGVAIVIATLTKKLTTVTSRQRKRDAATQRPSQDLNISASGV